MGTYVQILAFVIVGIALLWFGYTIFLGPSSPFYPGLFPWRKKKLSDIKGKAGEPQVCPICSVRLDKGEQVKTVAFPSASGGIDRLMYIKGCHSCLNSNIPRRCPVCGSVLSLEDYLVARMFERSKRKNHIHVLGCNHCKKVGNVPDKPAGADKPARAEKK
jgi:hypothetical protein